MKNLLFTICTLVIFTACNNSNQEYSSNDRVSLITWSSSNSSTTANYEFKYDTKGRVSDYLYTETYIDDGEEEVYCKAGTFSYNNSYISAYYTVSEYDSDGNCDYTKSYSVQINLDSNGIIESRGSSLFYTSENGKVTELSTSQGGDPRYTLEWDGENITGIIDERYSSNDYFEYNSSIANNASVDLNMFITSSENIEDVLYGPSFGFINDIGGIHSENMISQCTEEGSIYDIEYELDSKGRVIEARWDKYNSGKYITVSITY